MDLFFLISAFITLFAIIDPIAVVPVFLGMTEGFTHRMRQRIIWRAVTTAALVLLIFGLIGQYLFTFLGFTLNAFRIAGGILLFSVGFSMLHGKRPRTKVHSEHDPAEKDLKKNEPLSEEFQEHTEMARPKTGKAKQKRSKDPLEQEEIGVVPVGIPLLAGPGAITTMMIFMSDTDYGWDNKVLVIVSMLLIMVLTYFVMKYSEKIFSRIGRFGALALSRIMGLLLAAVAIQFIINGIIGVANEYGLIPS